MRVVLVYQAGEEAEEKGGGGERHIGHNPLSEPPETPNTIPMYSMRRPPRRRMTLPRWLARWLGPGPYILARRCERDSMYGREGVSRLPWERALSTVWIRDNEARGIVK